MNTLTVDFGEHIRPIKALHGVNNGPITFGSLTDTSAYYKEAGFPYVRLHDSNWPHPREVDIPQIFPDFTRDPEDPDSYDFKRTDDYLSSIVECGARIVYRLGTSIEHTKKKYFIHPPADPAKWAQICIGIIRHYNEGWAKGFEHHIKYWEIWNEPDGHPNVPPEKSGMWTGTEQNYFELYRTAAGAIKTHDPELKVGGYAATMINPGFMDRFFAYLAENEAPLDFFSWHTYSDNPERVKANAELVRAILDGNGYRDTESHFNEWNYVPSSVGGDEPGETPEILRRARFERTKGPEGATYAAAVLSLLQDGPVDVANYYDAQPHSYWCGIFDLYGVPTKQCYALKAFNALYRYGTQVRCATDLPDNSTVHCCAAVDETTQNGCVIVSNFSRIPRDLSLQVLGFAENDRISVECSAIDSERDLSLAASGVLGPKQLAMPLSLAPYSVLKIDIRTL